MELGNDAAMYRTDGDGMASGGRVKIRNLAGQTFEVGGTRRSGTNKREDHGQPMKEGQWA